MGAEQTNNIRAFKNLIDDQLTGGALPTVDEVLARWDSENETTEERDATVQALRESLDDMDAGDTGTPASEALDPTSKDPSSTIRMFHSEAIAPFLGPPAPVYLLPGALGLASNSSASLRKPRAWASCAQRGSFIRSCRC